MGLQMLEQQGPILLSVMTLSLQRCKNQSRNHPVQSKRVVHQLHLLNHHRYVDLLQEVEGSEHLASLLNGKDGCLLSLESSRRLNPRASMTQ